MSLLTLENIKKEYSGRLLLDGVCIRVHSGERLALVGANGSGKSTLLKIAMGEEKADSGRIITARNIKVGYLSQDLKELSARAGITGTEKLYEKADRLERKLRELEKDMADGELMGRPEKAKQLMKEYSRTLELFEGMDGYSVEGRTKAALAGLGLREEALGIPFESLSGGEKMRIALAKTLLEEPDLLIMDEPTNHLDIKAAEWLESYFRKFQGGVLLVSHDRYFLDRVATRIAELHDGSITEKSGNYSTYLEQKNIRTCFINEERKRLKREIRKEEQLALKLKGMRRISAANSRLKAAERLKNKLDTDVGKAVREEHLTGKFLPKLAFRQARHISAEVAKAEGLTKRFDSVTLFENTGFLIRGGEKVGIVGDNGSGKTTLLNILLGADTSFEGFARLGPWVRYGYLGQEIGFVDERRTVLEEILAKKELKDDEARDFLSRFQFYGDDIFKTIGVLSGGEKIRLILACIMLDEPNCLIMDEPTNHLDMPARDALELSLKDFRGTLIAVSHDRYFLSRCTNRILEISGCRINSYEGNYDFYRKVKTAEQPDERDRSDMAQVAAGSRYTNRKAADGIPKDKSHIDGKSSQKEEGIEKPLPGANVEASIRELEEKLKEMEASFNPDTPAEIYDEYASAAKELEGLYEAWINSQ